MGIGGSDGSFYEDDFDRVTNNDGNKQPGSNVDITFRTPPVTRAQPTDALKSSGGSQTPDKSSDIEDRRNESMIDVAKSFLSPTWLKDKASAIMANPMPGTEAQTYTAQEPDVGSTPLGNQLGYQDIPQPNTGANLPNIDDIQHHDWVERLGQGMYQSLKDLVTGPGRAVKGELQNPEDWAAGAAGTMVGMGGGIASGMKAEIGSLGSFAGVRSLYNRIASEGPTGEVMANVNRLRDAIKFDEQGVPDNKIWEATGWFKGADNRWKFELNSDESKLKNLQEHPDNAKEMEKYETAKAENPDVIRWRYPEGPPTPKYEIPKGGTTLGDILHYPDLYRHYPEAEGLSVFPETNPNFNGSYTPAHRNALGIDIPEQIRMSSMSQKNMRSTLLHEVQHFIQDKEGFSTGASPNAFNSPRWQALTNDFYRFQRDVEDKAVKALKPLAENLSTKEHPLNLFWQIKNKISYEDELPELERQIENAEAKGSKASVSYYQGRVQDIKNAIKIAKNLDFYDDVIKILHGEGIARDYEALANESYRRVKGEVEARNVQNRKDYNTELRMEEPPRSTEGVARSRQLWSPYDPASLKDLHK